MTVPPDRLRLLHGTDAPLPELRALRAGPARVLLDGIDLRYLRIGGTELVRRVYVAVRDVDWDTVPGEVAGLEVDERDDSLRRAIRRRHRAPRDRLLVARDDHRRRDGPHRRTCFDGVAEQELQYNRIGICVHHPWRETAGAPFRARTPDGEIEGDVPGPDRAAAHRGRRLPRPLPRL